MKNYELLHEGVHVAFLEATDLEDAKTQFVEDFHPIDENDPVWTIKKT